MGKYSVKPKSSKWTVAAMSRILDIACVNDATMSRLNGNNTPKTHKNEFFLFGWKLTMQLITPLLKQRHTSSNDLHQYTQQSIADHPRAPENEKGVEPASTK